MKKIKSPKDSPAMPGAPMSEEELKKNVKIAEKGPFYNIQQVSRQIHDWKTKYSK